MRWWPLLMLFGCTDYDGDELSDVVVDEAWIEDLDYSGMLMIAGGWSGGGTLVVLDPGGDRHELPVTLSGGGAGLALSMTGSFATGDVELDLPRGRIRGNQLLGKYKGSAEALAVLFGAQVNHLRNDDDVQMDFTTVSFGISVLVAAQWATLLPREDEPESGDTGWYGTTDDTEDSATFWWTPSETGSTGDTGT